jgi:hypothetical protein
MNIATLRIVCMTIALSFPATSVWGLTAKITMADGTVRMAALEGVGCSASICSRVAIKGKAEGAAVTTPLDSIAAIRDTTANGALIVMKDGTRRRLTLLNDFRVLYLANRSRGARKLDIATVKSVEFIACRCCRIKP